MSTVRLLRPPTSVPRLLSALALATAGLLAAPLGAGGPLGAAPAAAQGAENPVPPTASTSAASAITRTSAQLAASVTAGGAETTVSFEYGTTTAYGLTTAPVTVAAGESGKAIAQTIERLTASTTYHYRVVATNAAGTVRGSDRSFKTLANPAAPSVSTRSATGVSGVGATLVGRINPQGQATSYYFDYGTSTRYGSRTPVQQAGDGRSTITVTAPVDGLKPNTKHYFRLVATNATGTRRTSSRSFTTTRGISGVNAGAARRTVTWNTEAQISGTLSGLASGGAKVALLRQDHPYTGPWHQVKTATVNSGGLYSFGTGPLYAAARFQVITTSGERVASSWVTIHNRLWSKLRISKKRARSYRLAGRAYPLVPGARATLQRRTPKGRWIRVKSVRLNPDTVRNRMTYAVTANRLKARSARYRVRIEPRDGGAHVNTNAHSVLVKKKR